MTTMMTLRRDRLSHDGTSANCGFAGSGPPWRATLHPTSLRVTSRAEPRTSRATPESSATPESLSGTEPSRVWGCSGIRAWHVSRRGALDRKVGSERRFALEREWGVGGRFGSLRADGRSPIEAHTMERSESPCREQRIFGGGRSPGRLQVGSRFRIGTGG